METNPLIEYFNRILPLTEEEESAVERVFKERRVKRRQFILQEGEVSKINTFVIEGCLKMYLVDENGKEHNLQFAIEIGGLVILVAFIRKSQASYILRQLRTP